MESLIHFVGTHLGVFDGVRVRDDTEIYDTTSVLYCLYYPLPSLLLTKKEKSSISELISNEFAWPAKAMAVF